MSQDYCKDRVLAALKEKLPPLFCRRRVEELTGGLLTVCNLIKLDKEGLGPQSFKMGRKVGYEKESFLLWLEQRLAPRGKQEL
ncbi:hypothetical protein [Pseudodesulfovibrio pelocollis]|uniref:hypothetical protein n=1 Tax=Pseudodesulfovibrio pelocollis TaxID=3051432 RepID=UPI00255A733E|nr:hypothetical protein [Pseudodesulfovibrio sp. SB368]